jgi:hypothetical protein
VIPMGRPATLLLIVLAVWSVWAKDPAAGTVDSLVRRVQSELQSHETDKQIAKLIKAIHLTERLDDEAIEQLEAEGAGQSAIDELERQRDISHRLPPPAVPLKLFDAPAVPSAKEQSQVLEQARIWALQYTSSLPNFLCSKKVSRYSRHKSWKKEDTLTWEVGYVDGRDSQKPVAINGRPTQRTNVEGFSSIGEFGNIMNGLFRPEKETKFQWSRWSNLRGHLTHVFSYYQDKKHSGLVLPYFKWFGSRNTVTAMRGSVYIDDETRRVMRITYDADGIPSGFPIQDAHTVVDYGSIEIGGAKFLLPVRSTLRVLVNNVIQRNVTEFVNYRKFTSEVKIDFGKQ